MYSPYLGYTGTEESLIATKRAPDQLPNPKNNMWDLIAFYLRFLRIQRELSGEAIGRIMSIGKSSVSRLEIGESRLDGTQAKALDKAWDTGGLFSLLVWYASLGHDPQWYAQYVELEQRAAVIKLFEAQVIPGLLQTEDYARALLSGGVATNVDELVQDRMNRQKILTRPAAPFLSVILSQNALEWPVGSPEIMREQLGRLLEMTGVVLQVVPRTWETRSYTGLDGSFQLLSGDDFAEVAYTESPGGGRLVSSPAEVRFFVVSLKKIEAKALPEASSRALIKSVMEGLG